MWQIRKCSAADFEQVAGLLQQLWPSKQMNLVRLRQVYDRGLASASQCYVSAAQDGEMLGFCSLSFKNSMWQEGLLAWVDELVVAEHARGLGIGSALLDQVMDLARKCGARRIELDSAFHRKEAHAFYEKKGFEKRAFLFTKEL